MSLFCRSGAGSVSRRVMMPTRCFVPGATDQSSAPTEATVVTRRRIAFETTTPRPGLAALASTTSSWFPPTAAGSSPAS